MSFLLVTKSRAAASVARKAMWSPMNTTLSAYCSGIGGNRREMSTTGQKDNYLPVSLSIDPFYFIFHSPIAVVSFLIFLTDWRIHPSVPNADVLQRNVGEILSDFLSYRNISRIHALLRGCYETQGNHQLSIRKGIP